MKVCDVMTKDVQIANPQQTIWEVAKIMADLDIGALPVGENDRLVGMVTDRDIALRAIGCGQGPETKVGDIMSRDVRYCYEDDDLDRIMDDMSDLQIRRLPVISRGKRLVGIISLGDLALHEDEAKAKAGQTLSHISEHGHNYAPELPL